MLLEISSFFYLRQASLRRQLEAHECRSSIMRDEIDPLAKDLLRVLSAGGLTLVTAESCTAGLLAQCLADAPGAGACFHGGFVTYTKQHKSLALGVPSDLLEQRGAVCDEVARAMAEGALRHSASDLSAAITGVAGPEPDEDGNPVGLVCIAIARRSEPTKDFERRYLGEGRETIRQRAVSDTIGALISALTNRQDAKA
jgi:nicotinamide-nucleotide amidase